MVCFLTEHTITAQTFDLKSVVAMARENSLVSLQAENRKENSYWIYKTFQSNYKPQLTLSGALPDFNRTISPITLPDGRDAFVNRSLARSDASLQLSQAVGLTGGTIFIGSQLQRIDILEGAGEGVSYASNPLIIGFNQPIFGFNEFKWDREISPIRYQESIRRYSEDLERVSQQAADLFFDLLLAQISLEISQKNLANNDTIYRIAQGRYQLGKIAENDLIQLELNLLTSQQQVARAKLDLETTRLNLNTYIGRPDNEAIRLAIPAEIPTFSIDVETAIEQAKNNREEFLSYKRRRLEAQRDVAQARGESGVILNLTGTFGLASQSEEFGSLYDQTQDQQRVRLGLEVPILDWGRQKAIRRTAEANRELVNNTVTQEEINFRQEILTLIKQFDILREQVRTAKKADELGQKRYDIAQNRYLVAKISITDLNLALQEKDQKKQQYLQALREFWNAYYQIRRLTLYDFESNTPLLIE